MAEMNRREFLKKGLAGLAVAAVSRGAEAAPASPEQPMPQDELMNLLDVEIPRIIDDLYAFERKKGQILSPQQRDKVRGEFLSLFSKELPSLIRALLANEDKSLLTTAIYRFSDVDCQGKIFEMAAIQNQTIAIREQVLDQAKNRGEEVSMLETLYRIRTADFLPTAGELQDSEIDPRLAGILGRLDAQPNFKKEPGWSAPEKQAAFRALLNNQEVRFILKQANMTLAEAYSVIKAIIKEQEFNPSQKSEVEILDDLLEARQEFSKREVVGPSTDEVLIFSFHAELPDSEDDMRFKREQERLLKTLEAAQVPTKSIQTIDTSSTSLLVQHALLKSIADSQGNTVVFFNTHGIRESGKLVIGEDGYKNISAREVAHALVKRYQDSGDPSNLAQVTLIFGSCYSYNFNRELVAQFREILAKEKIDPETVALPTLIAAAQEDSSSSHFIGEINDIKKLVAEEGALTGELLLREVEPRHYAQGDATFFVSKHGRVQEIGRNESPAQHIG